MPVNLFEILGRPLTPDEVDENMQLVQQVADSQAGIAADAVATAADRVATGADRTAVAADKAATAADRVATGLDRTAVASDKTTATTAAGTATTQAGIATTKAGEAAASAAAAADAVATATPETATTIGALINGATAKATPVDADMFGLMDSAAGNLLKKLSWANIKTTLGSIFAAKAGSSTQDFAASAITVTTIYNAKIQATQSGTVVAGRYAQVILSHGGTEFTASTRAWQVIANALGTGEAELAFQYWNGATYTKAGFFSSTGNFLVGTATENITNGNAKIQSPNGIYLGNTANAAANVLDWYEEGTFPASLVGSTSGSFAGVGKYNRIGNRVFIDIEFDAITLAAKPIGNYSITGLPFLPAAGFDAGVRCATVRVTFSSGIKASVTGGSTTVQLTQAVSNDVDVMVTDANFVSTSAMYLRMQINYLV